MRQLRTCNGCNARAKAAAHCRESRYNRRGGQAGRSLGWFPGNRELTGRKVRTPWTRVERSEPKGNAPGNARAPGRSTRVRIARLGGMATDSATENKPPVRRFGDGREAKPFGGRYQKWTTRMVRVKRWGKSPPRLERSGRHGKPRVVQGQIGGEGRPGPQAAHPQGCAAVTLG